MQCRDVKLLPLAQADVDQALATVGAENPAAADALLEDILARLRQAAQFPQSGAEIVVGTRSARRYYRLYARPYCIYYRVTEDTILVMRVLHQRMDMESRL